MTFKELYCPCPSCTTPETKEMSNWYHPCGSKWEIDENGIIRCTGCHQTKHISKEQFQCANHEAKLPCPFRLVYVLGIIVERTYSKDREWSDKLTKSIGEYVVKM